MPTTQQYLSQNYPNKEITELNLSGWNENNWKEKPNWEKLTGELDLSEFPNLEKLDCSFNEITSLNLSNCPNLTELKCWDNQLTEIKFSNSQLKLKTFYAWTNNLTEIDWKNFNPENLTHVSISNNNLQEQNIAVFSQFTNLEELCLGNDIEERLEEDIRNRFTGSLKSLQNLNKLKKLQIEGTEIDDSELVKYLPKDLQVVSWGKEAIIKQLGLEKKGKEANKLRNIKDRNEFQKVLNEIVTNYAEKRLGSNLTSRQKEQIKQLGNSVAGNFQLEKNKAVSFKELKVELKNFAEMLSEIKDGMIAKTIPLERLYVIRGNLKHFARKWGGKGKDEIEKLETRLVNLDLKLKESNNQEEKKVLQKKLAELKKKLKQEENGWKIKAKDFFNKQALRKEEKIDELTEISKLQSPAELWKIRWAIYGTEFIGRSSAVVGAVLTFQDQGSIGGGILAVYPFAELLISKLEESLKGKEDKWSEFLSDADTFLDNYNELLGMLAQFEIDQIGEGKIDKVLEILNENVMEFLKIYDEDDNKEIDLDELINERSKLIEDLNKGKDGKEKSKIWEIVDSIKELELSIIGYRKSSYYEETVSNAHQKHESQSASISLDKWVEEKEKQETKIEINPNK